MITIPLVFVREAIGDTINSANAIANQIEELSFNESSAQPMSFQAPVQPSSRGGLLDSLLQGGALLGAALGKRGAGKLFRDFRTNTSRTPISYSGPASRFRETQQGRFEPLTVSNSYRGPPVARPAQGARANDARNISTVEVPSEKSANDWLKPKTESDPSDLFDGNWQDSALSTDLPKFIKKEVFKPDYTQ